MLHYLRRGWNYLTARPSGRFEQTADPKAQLEQAISEASDKHRRLREQASSVIANQRQTEMRINQAIEELETVNADTEQSADRLVTLEQEIERLKSLHFQATEAADQAKAAVAQNSAALQRSLSERQKLLGQLDQAKMQDQMDAAMETLSEGIGQDVATFDEVRERIEARYAQARRAAELVEGGVETGNGSGDQPA